MTGEAVGVIVFPMSNAMNLDADIKAENFYSQFVAWGRSTSRGAGLFSRTLRGAIEEAARIYPEGPCHINLREGVTMETTYKVWVR